VSIEVRGEKLHLAAALAQGQVMILQAASNDAIVQT
jgi:hypothetical protein